VLPNITCGEQPGALCCNSLWNTANHILAQVAPDLIECIAGCDCCSGQFYAYVSQGEPETFQSNYLAIWLVNLAPSIRSNSGTVTTFTPANLLRATWNMKLSEGGYPKMSADMVGTPNLPGFNELHYMNQYVYSHGEQMLRSVMTAAAENRLVPQGDTTFTLNSFGPIRNEDGSAGYQIGFVTDVHWQS